MNTLGRAVEQLAECLAKQSTSQQLRSKQNSHATPVRRVKMYYEYFKLGVVYQMHKIIYCMIYRMHQMIYRIHQMIYRMHQMVD